jgi:O-antigen/teichoic acid export membrane protein
LGIRPTVLRVIETIFASGLVITINLVTGVLAARMLGPEGRGELASILIGLQVASQLSVVGLPAAAIFNIKKAPTETSQYVGAVFILAVIFSLIASLLGFLIIPYWLNNYSHTIILAAQIVILASVFWAVLQVATPVLRARDEFFIFNNIRLLPPTATMICLIAMMVYGVDSPVLVAIPYALSTCIFVFWPLWWICRTCKPRFLGIGRQIRELLDYGSRSLAVDVVQTMSRFLDRILLVYLLAPAAVGLYVVAVSMARPLQELGNAIALVLLPKASGYRDAEAIAVSGLAGRVGLICMLVIGLPMVVVAPLLLEVLFGKAFLPAVPVFRLLLVAVIASSTADILSQAFLATGRPGTASLLRCLEMAALVGLLFYLVPKNGMIGAAEAILASAVIRFVATVTCYPLVLGHKLPRFYINRADLRQIRSARRSPAPAAPANE